MIEFINCYVINEKIYGDYIKNVLFGQLRRITLISAGIGLMLAFIELIFKIKATAREAFIIKLQKGNSRLSANSHSLAVPDA